jgi:hypothetical protein
MSKTVVKALQVFFRPVLRDTFTLISMPGLILIFESFFFQFKFNLSFRSKQATRSYFTREYLKLDSFENTRSKKAEAYAHLARE